MSRFAVPVTLVALLVILHGQLWLGRGSVSNVAELRSKLNTQLLKNEQIKADNKRLLTEINDLKGGLSMIEEKARMELGMIKANEIYIQIAR
ncbi:septum formation initiator family protein [Rhodoferax sp.]|uniref:septum formation initiator family protein n=1 Tax=Rhodoferax sp. TaxID=50421 RepID=UPI0026350269|nr:septum formation initiator family protein [Rhodoferax sp.]MDD4943206.1 septum formation initiator family protein [Rhodoferax sp.]MDD5479717.1 septum formation initiator family protein [Rhodoferax sp.]